MQAAGAANTTTIHAFARFSMNCILHEAATDMATTAGSSSSSRRRRRNHKTAGRMLEHELLMSLEQLSLQFSSCMGRAFVGTPPRVVVVLVVVVRRLGPHVTTTIR
jgi:hypothetical protein